MIKFLSKRFKFFKLTKPTEILGENVVKLTVDELKLFLISFKIRFKKYNLFD